VNTVVGVATAIIEVERARAHWIARVPAGQAVAIGAVKLRFQTHHIGGRDPAWPFCLAADGQDTRIVSTLIPDCNGIAARTTFTQGPIEVKVILDDVDLARRKVGVHVNLNGAVFPRESIGVRKRRACQCERSCASNQLPSGDHFLPNPNFSESCTGLWLPNKSKFAIDAAEVDPVATLEDARVPVPDMKTELIIATYNKPDHLRVVLNAIPAQLVLPDSICLADDGSGPVTKGVLEDFAAAHPQLNIRHQWHPDDGFDKNAILNRSIASSSADLLIFIDDDCVMHPDFIARHVALSAPDRFMAGSVIRLAQDVTRSILADGTVSWSQGVPNEWRPESFSDRLKSKTIWPFAMPLLDRLSPVRKNWAGGNASAFRTALLAVNGFDESLAYGGEDKELGARLINSGVKGVHLRYTAPLYHLDHGRGYVDPQIKAANRKRIEKVRRDGISFTPNGIEKVATRPA